MKPQPRLLATQDRQGVGAGQGVVMPAASATDEQNPQRPQHIHPTLCPPPLDPPQSIGSPRQELSRPGIATRPAQGKPKRLRDHPHIHAAPTSSPDGRQYGRTSQ